MSKGRMEAFSDGVIAILITIMVLELKVPHGADMAALRPLLPVFLSYVLSFVYLGIYWNNHHHLLHTVGRVSGGILWANLHLLFWLSLVPFVTGWMGENHFAALPMAVYGGILLLSGFAFNILQSRISAHGAVNPSVASAVAARAKGWISLILYALAIPLAFVSQWIAGGLYVLVALMWLIPDRQIEAALKAS